MATALDLINSALHLIGAKDPLESATAQEASDGLNSLNDLLDSWSTDRMFVFRVAEVTHIWPAATVSQTVGIGGDINIDRPLKVESSYIVDNGLSYPVNVLANRDGDNSIPQRTLSVNYPEWMFYDPAYPLATLYLYTVPASNLEFHFNYWAQLARFLNVTDTVNFPPGYARALRYNLAVEIASEYGQQVPASVASIAATSAGKIKRLNAPPVLSTIEVAYSPSRDVFSIYRGY